MSRKRRKARQRQPAEDGRLRETTPAPSQPDPAGAVSGQSSDEDLASYLERDWRQSRSGAISGRGYHYQDEVGSWLALRVQTGELRCERLLPEGLDDLSCEGTAACHVQVKSRQARIGDFSIAEAASHVFDTWERHSARRGLDPRFRLIVVFERSIEGSHPTEWETPLGASPDCIDLARHIRDSTRRCPYSPDELEALLSATSVMVLPQGQLRASAAELAATVTGLPVGAAIAVVRALRIEVAEHADRNAQPDWGERSGLSRTDINRVVTEAAALVDRQALEEAIATGVCEPVDFDTPLQDETFYQGKSVQPGHVVAGLVVPRPHVTDEVLAGLDSERAVLVAGPSGVGKSAVTWMAAYVVRHVQWYRVNRLREHDVEPLIRLARAAGAGRYAPVGFVVDGVGVGALAAWDQLLRNTAAIPGVVLLGSVREEDLLPLETLGDCVVVRPRLDEALAARIHHALKKRTATAQVHWREAYEQADGLTLEFTHLLTKGRRLNAVITDQVRARVREHRDLELAVLGPVGVADRWGAALSIGGLLEELGTSAPALKHALGRLVAEHLLAVEGDSLSGLHPLRSAAICDAVHDVPPPSLRETVRLVVRRLDASQIRGFLARALSDHPELGHDAVDELLSRLASGSDADAVLTGATLDGLRLADFAAAAQRWVGLLDRHEVPPALQPLTLELAMLDVELLDALDARLLAAAQAIRADRTVVASELRERLVVGLSSHFLADQLARCSSIHDAMALLGPLASLSLDLPVPDAPTTALASFLRHAPLGQVSSVIQAATAVSASLGQRLVALGGGLDTIVRRLRETSLWVLDLEIVSDGDETVIRGRKLHVSDRLNPDPNGSIRDLARLALGCLPDLDRADLVTVWPGGIPMTMGDHQMGVSGLLRRYAHGPAVLEWNKARSRYARSLIAAESDTTRMASSADLLDRTAAFLQDLVGVWCVARGRQHDVDRLNRARAALLDETDRFMPRGPRSPVGAVEDLSEIGLNDAVHTVAQGIVHNLAQGLGDQGANHAALAAFVGNTLRKQLLDIDREPWGLLGLSAPPPTIAQLRTTLTQLHAVLAELAWGDMTTRGVAAAARQTRQQRALAHVADLAMRRAVSRHNNVLSRLRELASERGVTTETLTTPDPEADATTWPPCRTAILIHLGTLIDLPEAQATIGSLLSELRLPPVRIAIIPIRAGAPVQGFAAVGLASGNIYPDAEVVDLWRDTLPSLRAFPFLDAVVEANHALQELSGLAYFERHRSDDQLTRTVATEAAERYREALERINGLPGDDTTRFVAAALTDLADSVQAELDGAPGSRILAEAVVRGAVIDPTQELQTVTALTILAAEWDLDPLAAVALLD